MKIFDKIKKYSSFIKFHHSIFAFPFLIGGLFLAPSWRELPWHKWLAIIVAMISARSAAMGFNRVVDAKFDQRNPRTHQREIPAGKISKSHAYLFVTINVLIFIFSAFYLNTLAFIASPFVLVILLGYSFTKRFTCSCHFILGFAIGLAPTAGWVAVTGSVELPPVLLSGALMFYISGFDLLYSTQDAEFDRIHTLHSIPANFGIRAALVIARVNHLISLGFFYFVGTTFNLKFFFWVGLTVIGLLMVLEHLLVKKDNLSKVPMAFFHVNSIISIVVGLSLIGGIFGY